MAATVKIFFKTETITYGNDEEARTLEVSELMPAGALLAAIEGDGSPTAKPADRSKGIELIPGAFVEFSADNKALLATQPGYPRLTRKKEGAGTRITVELEPLVRLDPDGWSVKLTLYPPPQGTELPDSSEIVALLEKADVRYGIREKSIAACLAAVRNERQPQINQTIVRGRLPVHGENGRVRIDVAVGAQPGKELGDGRMDFRERRLFIGVDKGQLLATRVPATKGIPGVNIYGHEIPQVPGKDLVIKPGADISYDEQTGEIRAACGGVLSIVNETTIRVSSRQIISGDIDYATGNIDSRDAVEIGGSIRPGFKVSTGGDLVIGGNIESAHIASRANVVIRGGMTGKSTTIEADGDVDIPFIENGSITCRGSVTIRKQAYYTEIRSLRDVCCEGETTVVGSRLFAGGSIRATRIDTPASPHSLLAAATDPARYSRYRELLDKVRQAQTGIDAWIRRFGPGVTNEDLRELEEERTEALLDLTAFNLIPLAAENDKSSGLRYACMQKIIVAGDIQAGAGIRIGNTETTLKKNYRAGFFALNSESERIEFHPKQAGAPTERV